MKITSQQELEALIVNHEIVIQESVEFTFSFSVDVSIRVVGNIKAWDINARDINAWNIKAWNINAGDINAWNIKAWDINARNINARDINARDINAWNINAGDIKAWDINARNINARDINARDINAWNINAGDINARDINARDISFFAVCVAYVSLKCKSLVGRRGNAKFLCLDSLPIIEAASKEGE